MKCPHCNVEISDTAIASYLGKKGGTKPGSGPKPRLNTPEAIANRERVRKHRAKKRKEAQ